jgi:hypothetical protein
VGCSWHPGRSHNGEAKKFLLRFCCVTTRGRNFRVLNGLRRGVRLLAARFLRLGVSGLDGWILATSGLPSSRLPAAKEAQAF